MALTLRLKIGEPLFVLAVLPFDDIEESFLNIFGHRTPVASADLTVVHFTDRRQLRRRAGKKGFVGDVKFISRKALFNQFITFVPSQCNDRVSSDARQDRSQWRSFDLAVT